jgi:hypothetical protein
LSSRLRLLSGFGVVPCEVLKLLLSDTGVLVLLLLLLSLLLLHRLRLTLSRTCAPAG